MVSQAGARRENREKRSRITNIVATLGTTVIGLLLFVLPRTGTWITVDLILAWVISLYCVWHCWTLECTWKLRLLFLVLHTVFAFGVGYAVWPRIVVSPATVSFRGYSDETFNFSIRNERGDDVYNVEIPFVIGYGKNLDSKISARVIRSNEPSQPLHSDYAYCYGVKGAVDKVLPNEKEQLVVRIEHLPPAGIGTFTVTYAGGEGFTTKPENPSFLSEPYSYSATQGTIDVRGDHRICKIVGQGFVQ